MPLLSKRKCARGSMRTITSGKATLLVCCPKGEWMSRKKRCRVGTFAKEKVVRRKKRK